MTVKYLLNLRDKIDENRIDYIIDIEMSFGY